MNLIAALIVLVFGASFNPAIELPFKLVDVEKSQTENGIAGIKSTKILIFTKNNSLIVGIAGKEFPLKDACGHLKEINPALPVILLVERRSGLRYSQLVEILSILKSHGVKNVSLVAQET